MPDKIEDRVFVFLTLSMAVLVLVTAAFIVAEGIRRWFQ